MVKEDTIIDKGVSIFQLEDVKNHLYTYIQNMNQRNVWSQIKFKLPLTHSEIVVQSE